MVAHERLDREAGLQKCTLLRGRQWLHVIIEAGNEDPAGPAIHTGRHYLHQLGQRIPDGTAGDSGVEISRGSAEPEHEWLQTTQTGWSAGFATRDPDRIGDDD